MRGETCHQIQNLQKIYQSRLTLFMKNLHHNLDQMALQKNLFEVLTRCGIVWSRMQPM